MEKCSKDEPRQQWIFQTEREVLANTAQQPIPARGQGHTLEQIAIDPDQLSVGAACLHAFQQVSRDGIAVLPGSDTWFCLKTCRQGGGVG